MKIMNKTYIFEGNTTNAAIEQGLKELKVSRNEVEIKVLEENKKSFFSILAPRVVKVEIILKEPKIKEKRTEKLVVNYTQEEIDKEIKFIEQFINELYNKLNVKDVTFTANYEDNIIKVCLDGESLKYLIGYRGDTLNSIEILLNFILKNNKYNIKVSCNINSFREKRLEALYQLAEKVSKTVIKTGKSITLEPMPAYERKIIHTKLQDNNKIKTFSVGEGKHRRIVIELK